MENLDELKHEIERLRTDINDVKDIVQYEPSSEFDEISTADATDEPTAVVLVNELKSQYNLLIAELKRINFMQSRG